MNNTWQSKEVVNYNVGIMTFNMDVSTLFIHSHVKRGIWRKRNSGEEVKGDKKGIMTFNIEQWRRGGRRREETRNRRGRRRQRTKSERRVEIKGRRGREKELQGREPGRSS